MLLESLLCLLKINWVTTVRQKYLLEDVLKDLVDPLLELFLFSDISLASIAQTDSLF